MGTFHYPIEIGDPQGQQFERIAALVDTGASYTTVPTSLLGRLGVPPGERRQFRLADDSVVERDTGITMVRLDGRVMPTVVVFAPEGAEPLLGAYTLEGFGLGVDPVGRRLMPVPGLLMGL